MKTIIKADQSAAEHLAHLSAGQMTQILHDACRNTFDRRPLRQYRAGFSAADVVARFVGDQTLDEAGSAALGYPFVATRGEIASMVIARQKAMASPKPDYGQNIELADALARDDS